MNDTFDLAAPIRIGTRSSELAVVQATAVADALVAAGWREGYELVEIGDRIGGDPSLFAGGQLMTASLRDALFDGRCDAAVHMLKDLPTHPHAGLQIAAYLKRTDPREALCARDGLTLDTLPEGARIGISSTLRRAQVLERRPDLDVVGVRGSIETRLQRITEGELDATIVAYPVVARLGLTNWVTELIEPGVVLPTPAQGALVIETGENLDPRLLHAVRRLDHLPTRLALTAERAAQATLEDHTEAPIGALARMEDTDSESSHSRLVLDVIVCGPDRRLDIRRQRSALLADIDTEDDADAAIAEAQRLGTLLAEEIIDAGATKLPGQKIEKTYLSPRPRVLVPHVSERVDQVFDDVLRKAGGEPVFVQLTRTIPAADSELDGILDRLPSADRVGMTSAEAVVLLDKRAHQRDSSLADVLADTPVAAFGASVGAALVSASVTVDMLPSLDSSVGNLLSVWPPADDDSDTPLALLPGSSNPSPLLAQGLTQMGWKAVELPVYTSVTADPSHEVDDALSQGWPEVLIVTSRSVAKAVEELLGMPPKDVRIVAVGRIPARDAKALGLRIDAVSPSPKPSAIAEVALAGVSARTD